MSAVQQARGELRFADVKAALRWYFAMQARMQGVRGVRLGRVGVEEVLATVATIGTGLSRLEAWDARVYGVVVMGVRDGLSQREIAAKVGCKQAAVSGMVRRGEAFLAGVWVRGGRAAPEHHLRTLQVGDCMMRKRKEPRT